MVNEMTWPLMHNNITRDDLDALIEYLSKENPKLTHGPKVMEFENAWSDWLGVKYSIMVNSGSSANDLTMMALRELRGLGEIIVPPLTWVSDIASVINAGHKPVFVDIDPKNLAMQNREIMKAITPETKAVFLTHVLGYNGISDELILELKNRGIPLIEDVCESHGATHKNQKLGSFGWASNFSFYYAHHLTTIEGGIISTDDPELYDVIRMLRSHGMVRESLNPRTSERYQAEYQDLNPDFIFAYPSHNMRSTELNAVLGLQQLKRLDKNNFRRSENLKIFLNNLDADKYRTDFDVDGSSNYAFTLVLKKADMKLRNKVEEKLREKGVEFRRGLSGGGNQLRQPYLRRRSDIPRPEEFPNVEHVHHFGWYIGNYPELPAEKIYFLCDLLNQIES
jgi:CDP-6-deoxy-D-xylo-4-hexulose-3-dehydrase